ncbi:ORFL113W, partial [Human betaherpesvirus 5]
ISTSFWIAGAAWNRHCVALPSSWCCSNHA